MKRYILILVTGFIFFQMFSSALIFAETYEILYNWVEGTKLRKTPGFGKDVICDLSVEQPVIWSMKKSIRKAKVTLQGKKIKAPFYYVRLYNGKEGWVYAGALKDSLLKDNILVAKDYTSIYKSTGLDQGFIGVLEKGQSVVWNGKKENAISVRDDKVFKGVLYYVELEDGRSGWVFPYNLEARNKTKYYYSQLPRKFESCYVEDRIIYVYEMFDGGGVPKIVWFRYKQGQYLVYLGNKKKQVKYRITAVYMGKDKKYIIIHCEKGIIRYSLSKHLLYFKDEVYVDPDRYGGNARIEKIL